MAAKKQDGASPPSSGLWIYCMVPIGILIAYLVNGPTVVMPTPAILDPKLPTPPLLTVPASPKPPHLSIHAIYGAPARRDREATAAAKKQMTIMAKQETTTTKGTIGTRSTPPAKATQRVSAAAAFPVPDMEIMSTRQPYVNHYIKPRSFNWTAAPPLLRKVRRVRYDPAKAGAGLFWEAYRSSEPVILTGFPTAERLAALASHGRGFGELLESLRKSHKEVRCPITVSPLHPSVLAGRKEALVTNVFQEDGAILFPHQEHVPLGNFLDEMFKLEEDKASGGQPPDFLCVENCPEAART